MISVAAREDEGAEVGVEAGLSKVLQTVRTPSQSNPGP